MGHVLVNLVLCGSNAKLTDNAYPFCLRFLSNLEPLQVFLLLYHLWHLVGLWRHTATHFDRRTERTTMSGGPRCFYRLCGILL